MTKKTDKQEQAAQLEQPAAETVETTVDQTNNADVTTTDKDSEQTTDADIQPSADGLNVAYYDSISVVIPFFAKKNKEEELILTIRSCRKFLHREVRFVVIGDPVNVVEDIPFEQIEYKDAQGSQFELLEVLKLAVVSDYVSEKFILIEPGTYLIDDVELHHIELGKNLGPIVSSRYAGEEAVLMYNTANLLRNDLHIAAYDYNTHAPFVLKKENVAELFEFCRDILSGKYHVMTVYCCAFMSHPVRLDYKTDDWLLPIVSQNPDRKTVEKLISNKCFLYIKYFENTKYLNPFLDIE